MSVDDRLLLVIPCYNEAARLDRRAISEALAHMAWLDVCFVDDGSTDQTAALLESMRAAWPDRVSIVSLARNEGKAEAVRQGLLSASTRSVLCGFWDADLSAPLSELIPLRNTLISTSHLEWVWGIRLRALGHRVERQAMRHYLGRVFATVASVCLGVSSYDTQCGAKLFRVTPLLRDVIAEPFVSRWVFAHVGPSASASAINAGTRVRAVVAATSQANPIMRRFARPWVMMTVPFTPSKGDPPTRS